MVSKMTRRTKTEGERELAEKEMPGVDEVPGVEGLRTNRGAKIFYHKI